MKVLFVLENYLPTKNGGIENYTHWLATLLLTEDYEVEVAYLTQGQEDIYYYEGIKVNRLVDGLASFEVLLRQGKFHICHFQEYSAFGGIEVPWFKKASELCSKVFFTFHLPYLTCYKGDFRFHGIEDCNNFSSMTRCVECLVTTKFKSITAGRVTSVVNKVLDSVHLPTITKRLEEKIQTKNETLDELLNYCSQVFIYAEWFKNILQKNGYNQHTIQTIPYKTSSRGAQIEKDRGIKRKILFVARIEPAKGLHLLCTAMNMCKELNIELDVYGNIVDEAYYKTCFKTYQFNFKNTITRTVLLDVFADYDFLILPSVFTEMYSLVLRDAFYEKLPVIVSSAKGNMGAVKEGQSGFIFKYNDAADLARVLKHSYVSLENGWQGNFDYVDKSESDEVEILSYYN